MRANNSKLKNNQRTQIVKNKDLFQSEDLSQQLWPSNRQSQSASRNQIPQKAPNIFDIPTLLQIFTQHYVAVQQCFQLIGSELTKLQGKLAECFGRFNEIEWKLNREIHEVGQAKSLNESLMRINKEIEDKLAIVKNDYEQLKRRRYVSSMEQKIEQLQETVHKMELKSYRNKYSKQDLSSLEVALQKLGKAMSKMGINHNNTKTEQILKEIIEQMLKLLHFQGNASEWVSQKLQENIRLKFQLIKLQSSQD